MSSSGAWKKLGLSSGSLGKVIRYDCDPAMEMRIETLAVRDAKFWHAFGDLVQPEFFAGDLSRFFMTLVHEFSNGYATPDHIAARDLALRSALVPDAQRVALLSHIDTIYAQPIIGIAYTSELVQDMARRRAVRAAVIRIAQLNEKTGGEDPVDEIAEVMQAALSLASRDPNPVVNLNTDHYLLAEWVAAYGHAAVPTFITSLDRALWGGLLPGELGVVLAPPHRGKSLTLVNFGAGAIICGRDVLYVSLEDGIRGIGPRLYSRLTGTPSKDFGKKLPIISSELQQLMPLFNGQFRLVYRPPRRTAVRDIRALLDRLNNEDGFRPAALIIDYADRLRPPRRRKDKWDELIDIYMDLRGLAEEYQTAIWTASQTGKMGFSKDVVDMDDFAGAFGKAAEADVVLAYCQTPKERDAGQARLHLAKMRNRDSGQVIHVYVHRPTSTIAEVPTANITGLVCNQKPVATVQYPKPKTAPGSFPGARPLGKP